MKKLSDKKFEAIFKRHKNLVYFIVSKYVDDTFDRESLTADVFLKFYQNHEGVDDVKYYLAKAAKNVAIDFLKKKKNISVSLSDAAEIVYVDEGYKSGYRDAVEDMKNVLGDIEIDTVLSHAVFGETFSEIAERQQRPPDSVYYTYRSAIKKYKKYKEEKVDE